MNRDGRLLQVLSLILYCRNWEANSSAARATREDRLPEPAEAALALPPNARVPDVVGTYFRVGMRDHGEQHGFPVQLVLYVRQDGGCSLLLQCPTITGMLEFVTETFDPVEGSFCQLYHHWSVVNNRLVQQPVLTFQHRGRAMLQFGGQAYARQSQQHHTSLLRARSML